MFSQEIFKEKSPDYPGEYQNFPLIQTYNSKIEMHTKGGKWCSAPNQWNTKKTVRKQKKHVN